MIAYLTDSNSNFHMRLRHTNINIYFCLNTKKQQCLKINLRGYNSVFLSTICKIYDESAQSRYL